MTVDLQKVAGASRLSFSENQRQDASANFTHAQIHWLDGMRERTIAIRGATPEPDSSVLRENPVPYRITPNPRNV
jgi:hypothetical protein